MSNGISPAATYRHPLVGAGYDLLARLVFAPVGGLDALRAAALDEMGLAPGMHVLELGCGTGALTAAMLERGAVVTAVDQSEPMLRRARRRAPAATFATCELTTYRPARRFDRVLFAFVLHELDAAARRVALTLARDALAPGGAVTIVDHALPTMGLVPRAVSALVHGFEPATVVDVLRDGFAPELADTGLVTARRLSLAAGLAVAMRCRPG